MIGIYFREMNCIYCESNRVVKNGKKQSGGKSIQRYLCNECGKRCNERSGTPIARLRTPVETIAMAMKLKIVSSDAELVATDDGRIIM
jgi:transposase-like protein